MASIRKRKDRKSTRWIVDGRDLPGGRRLTVATKEQAELERAKMVAQGQQAQPVLVDRDATLDAYADRWLAQIATSLEPRTLGSYRATLRLHIRPAYGAVKLRALHRGHVKALLAKKRADGLSKNSVRIIRATLSVMLADAVDDGLILANPAHGLGRQGRRGPESSSPEREKVKAMDHPQLAAFLSMTAQACEPWLSPLFLGMADAGLRPGEACGLKWTDLDVSRRTLRIERAVENSGRIKGTKTHRARTVDCSARLVAALRDRQEMAEADALMTGQEPSPWCFPVGSDRTIRPPQVNKVFAKLAKRAGLPRDFTPYSLRHTYASHLIAANAPPTYIAAQLGHSKVTTTLDHYAHLFENDNARYVEQLATTRGGLGPEWHRFGTGGLSGPAADAQVLESSDERRGSSVAEQLIRNQ